MIHSLAGKPLLLQALLMLTLLSLTFGAASCVTPDVRSDNTSSTSAASETTAGSPQETPKPETNDDPEEFAKLVTLPAQPVDVIWIEEAVGNPANPTDRKLRAAVRFKTEDTTRIIESAKKFSPAEPFKLDAEDWFPDEIIAQTQTSGDQSLDASVYHANDFLMAPFQDGRLIKIERSDFIILELTTN